MKLLIFSDAHAHPFRMFADHSSGENSRRMEILQRVETIVDLTRSGNYDAVLFAGDFYHERGKIDTVTLVYAKRILERMHPATKFIACSGTHDLARDGKSALTGFEDEESKFVVDKPVVLRNGADTVIILSVPDPILYETHEEKIQQELNKFIGYFPKILLTHGFVVGSPEFEIAPWLTKGVNQRYLRDNFILSVVGHLHKPILSTSQDSGIILIPGAVIPHNFGDDCGGGSYWECEISGGNVLIRRHLFEHPKFLTVTDGFQDFSREDYYRVTTSSRGYVLPEGIRGFSQLVEQAEARSERSGIRLADSPETLIEKYSRNKPPEITEIGKSIFRGLSLPDSSTQESIEEIMSRKNED